MFLSTQKETKFREANLLFAVSITPAALQGLGLCHSASAGEPCINELRPIGDSKMAYEKPYPDLLLSKTPQIDFRGDDAIIDSVNPSSCLGHLILVVLESIWGPKTF